MLSQYPKASGALYLLLSAAILYLHYGIARYETFVLLPTFAIAFMAYLALSRYALPWQAVLGAGIIIRLALLAGLPTLSDDFYRFIWDGRLLASGTSPFAQLPSWYMQYSHGIEGLDASLFSLLNSPEYYTVYPPISQFVFWLAAVLSQSIQGQVLVMRFIIIGADVLNFFLLIRLLSAYQLPISRAALYLLNPLVILELTGNIHFEGLMLTFVLLVVLFHHQRRDVPTGIALAAGVATKLIPMAVAPLLMTSDRPRRWLLIGAVCIVTLTLLFLPIIDGSLLTGLQQSLALFIQRFEFNASIYFLVREAGYWIKGYNVIGTLGPVLTQITAAGICLYAVLSRKNPNLSERMMWVWMIYLALALIVHPWYCLPMVALCLLTPYRFPIYWSGLIFLSYAGYAADGYTVPVYWITLEYAVLFVLMIWEVRQVNINLKIA